MNPNTEQPSSESEPLHKPDIRQANVCPPLPKSVSGLDRLIYWLGIGLGSGLPKRAPGTWGTLGGLALAIPLMTIGFLPFVFVTAVSCIAGVWICDRTSQLMQVHDDPHIVWDEWAGMLISLIPMVFISSYLPEGLNALYYWLGLLLAFVLFRFFDIVKPNPIKWADVKVSGGFGIMLDDILAGIMAMIVWSMIVMMLIRLNLL